MIFKLVPSSGARQKIDGLRCQFSDGLLGEEFIDLYGNLGLRALLPAGETTLDVNFLGTEHEEMVHPSGHFVRIERLPVSVLTFLQPSRYCESDQIGGITRAVVKNSAPGAGQIDVLLEYLSAHFSYRPGTSQSPRGAFAVSQDDGGVCRDFAHLMIAMLRSLSIPARYCVGYLEGLVPQDIHAWCEAFVGDRWLTIETTPGLIKGERILVAVGRDAADVAVMDQFGPLPLKSTMTVTLTD